MTEQGQRRETTMQMPGKAHTDPRCGCGECVGYLTAWETVCSPLMLGLATLRTSAATASIYIADLSPDAQEVLRRVVAKFRAGVEEHGPLNVTSRRWGPELLNEAIDMLHYAIFELMRLEKLQQSYKVGTDSDCGCLLEYVARGGKLSPGLVITHTEECMRWQTVGKQKQEQEQEQEEGR